MIIGFHFIFSAYGFWLPNDPRGSWSNTIRQFALLPFGPATKVTTTRSLAHRIHDSSHRRVAKNALRYPPVRFNGRQARAIANGIGQAISEHHYVIHALAILPDHMHLLMRHHRRNVEEIARHLKAKTTQQLSREGIHPMKSPVQAQERKPSPWARGYWCPFICDDRHMQTAARYIRANPVRAGFKPQCWNLVTPLTR